MHKLFRTEPIVRAGRQCNNQAQLRDFSHKFFPVSEKAELKCSRVEGIDCSTKLIQRKHQPGTGDLLQAGLQYALEAFLRITLLKIVPDRCTLLNPLRKG